MMIYPRPTEEFLFVEKKDVAARCPECGSANVKEYPVVSEGGWWEVRKCQDCLASLDRRTTRNRLGGIQTLSDFL